MLMRSVDGNYRNKVSQENLMKKLAVKKEKKEKKINGASGLIIKYNLIWNLIRV